MTDDGPPDPFDDDPLDDGPDAGRGSPSGSPFGAGMPFSGGMPFPGGLPGGFPGGADMSFGDMGAFLQGLSSMLAGGSGSGGSWDAAAQLAGSIATQGRSEPNLDPADRIAVEQLARVAELQVQGIVTVGSDTPVRLEPLNRTQWARRFLDDERPLLERLSGSLGRALQAQLGELEKEADDDPLAAMGGLGSADALIRQVMAMMGPMLLGMMAGSTAGHLAARAFGHYELPLPRPTDGPITMVLSNVDEFADEWSLPRDSVRLWVVLSDVTHHRVLGIPHVRAHLDELLSSYSSGFNDDVGDMERRMEELGIPDLLGTGEPDMAALQRLAGDPDILLGAMQSDAQRELMPRIETLVATIEGYVDHVLDRLGRRLLADYDRVTEAMRRRRVEFGPERRFVERLFGLELRQATFDRGASFVEGLVDRAGVEVLDELWVDVERLPTPAELGAPGLWLARVGVDVGDGVDDLPELDEPFEVPDFLDLGDDGTPES
ncbi:MAG TPA: zinc-dependent metalloprotease [Microthrixaceae bacterium]|nr:zinc-dependent metalloprotease [Microthrixaceae bacterium]